MSGASGNQLSFIFPDSVYKYLNTGSEEITETDCNRLVENINKFDKCYDNSGKLKNYLLGLLGRNQLNNETISNISCITEDMKTKILSLKSRTDILDWCNKNFTDDYDWLNGHNEVFQKLKEMKLDNAQLFTEFFVFLDDEGKEVPINEVVFEKLPVLAITAVSDRDIRDLDGGAYNGNDRLRLNLKKNDKRIPILMTSNYLGKYASYVLSMWRGESATYPTSSSSTPSNPADCSPAFNSDLDKRHIKPWTPREHGSSAGTVNAMSHLRRMASQPRITQVELSALGPLLARGFMGGSMEGGAPLNLTFSDCASGNDKGDKLSIRQSSQYLNLFKSVVQRLNKHNPVDTGVITRLESDLNAYRDAECKLFQDAFRLANALKSQNNGTLSGNITDLEAFKNASDEVAKKETHLIGCLTDILTKACEKK